MGFKVHGVSVDVCVEKQLRRAEESGDWADDVLVGRSHYRDFCRWLAERYAYSARLSAPFEQISTARDFEAYARSQGCTRLRILEC